MKTTPHSYVLLEPSGNTVVGGCTFFGDCISDPSTVLCYCSQGPSDVSALQPSAWISLELRDSADAEVAAATAQLCCDVQEDSFEAKLDAQQHDRQSDDETRGAFPYTKWPKIRYDILC